MRILVFFSSSPRARASASSKHGCGVSVGGRGGGSRGRRGGGSSEIAPDSHGRPTRSSVGRSHGRAGLILDPVGSADQLRARAGQQLPQDSRRGALGGTAGAPAGSDIFYLSLHQRRSSQRRRASPALSARAAHTDAAAEHVASGRMGVRRDRMSVLRASPPAVWRGAAACAAGCPHAEAAPRAKPRAALCLGRLGLARWSVAGCVGGGGIFRAAVGS